MTLSARIGKISIADPGPLYLRLRNKLVEAIEAGTLEAGSALPSERELCDDFHISRVTVRKAIGTLADEGRIVRKRGAGTFVADTPSSASATPRVEKSFSALSSFSEDMIARGLTPSSQWISRAAGMVTPAEALALALSPGSPVYRFQRIRLANDRPMAIEYSTIPGFCLPGVETVRESLYDALRKSGFRPARALQRLRAVPYDAAQADLLGVEPGHAGLLIERRSFLQDGRAAELTLSFYRGDAYDFVAELTET